MSDQSADLPVFPFRVEVFVQPERVADFQARLLDLNAQCARQPGFLGMGADSPGPAAASMAWMLSYKFDSPQTRDAAADVVRAGVGAMSDLFTRPPVVSTAEALSDRRPLEVVWAHVPKNRSEEYRVAREQPNALASASPGFLSIDTFPPAAGEEIWVTQITFDSQASLDRWLASPKRREAVGAIQGLARDEVKVLPTGFGQWFSVNAVAMTQTPAWKQAMTVLAVLFAMVSLLNLTIGDAVGPGWTIEGTPIYKGLNLPFPMVVFIGNAIGTCLLTWVLMPIVTRLLAWWLDPGATRRRTIQGVVLLVVIYIVEVAIFTTINRTLGI